MEQITTIGTLAATVFGLAAEAAMNGALGEAAKDAYSVFKEKLKVWATNDVESFERQPLSRGRKEIIAEVIHQQSDREQAEVRELALKLTAALRKSGDVGVEIGRLDALDVEFGNISVSDGVGVRLGEARIQGSFSAGNIEVNSRLGKR